MMTSYAKDLILRQAVFILEHEFNCHTIIFYGSRVQNTATETSDYDLIGFNEGTDSFRCARIVEGKYLDLWVYPESKLLTPDVSMRQAMSGVVLTQKNGMGQRFLSSLLKYADQEYSSVSEWDKNVQRVWALKMFERAYVQDIEGNYRKHWLLFDLLESYHQLRDLPYHGPKKALSWLLNNDHTTHLCFEKALETATMFDLIRLIHRVTQSNKKYYFMRHADAELEAGTEDVSRGLTSIGEMQCEKKLAALEGTPFNLVISSTAVRAQQTASYFVKEREIELYTSDALYFPKNNQSKAIILKDLNNKQTLTPAMLLQSESKAVWLDYAITALLDIMKLSCNPDFKNILVVGHGVIINLIGYLIDPTKTELLNVSLSPAEGFYVK